MLRFLRIAPLVALCLATASCTMQKTDSTGTSGTTGGADSAQAAMTPVQRGQYLATISGCHDCHTPGTFYGAPDMSRALSGSELGWEGPWGVSYAPNLTPDSTGLASWTDEEIIRALTNGVKKDGTPIAPPMPWPSYAHYTPSDASALIAYLRSLPPIPHEVPARVAPGGKATGPKFRLPPPPDWDKPRTNPS